jgi:alcohol dehydrogenase (NADP+)
MTEKFRPAPDAVDPAAVPRRTLRTGATMPAIGLGTFGSDRFSGPDIASAVRGALGAGYRFIDCAAVYLNEPEIGEVLAEALAGGLPREDLFAVSKVWNDRHAPADVAASCRRSLADLRLDHLDGYLVHWPFPNYHRPFADGDERSPDSRPYLHEEFMRTWAAMESLVDEGLVRHIGTSNVTVPKLRLILRDARIAPSLNEMELHPTFQQGELFQFCLDNDVQPVGFCPIGSPTRPDRDTADDDLADTEQPAVVRIAQAHGVHPAVVCVKWAVQRGQVPIPFSIRPNEYVSNLRSVTEDPLTAGEMAALRGVDRNCRLIKGQVFLWEGAGSWQDLWDVDGTIPGWGGYDRP